VCNPERTWSCLCPAQSVPETQSVLIYTGESIRKAVPLCAAQSVPETQSVNSLSTPLIQHKAHTPRWVFDLPTLTEFLNTPFGQWRTEKHTHTIAVFLTHYKEDKIIPITSKRTQYGLPKIKNRSCIILT